MQYGVPSRVRDVVPFSGAARRALTVFRPRNEDELATLLTRLHRDSRRSAPLGSALSFDGQRLPSEIAIHLGAFRKIEVDPTALLLRAGAGVTTGAALDATLRHGCVIPVLPSCSHITLGGTASSNAYSRMTPGLGRESRSIRALRLVTATGEALRCSRSENTELFRLAVGGFGLVGYITEIEYELIRVGPHPAFMSRATAHGGASGFDELMPGRVLEDGFGWPGAGAIVMHHGGRIRTMVSRHRYADCSDRRRTVAHQDGPRRLGLEVAAHLWPELASRFWQTNWIPRRSVRFIDDVPEATFFMDGHLRASRWLRAIRGRGGAMQQSFVLPVDGSVGRVSAFVEEAIQRFSEHRIQPAMLDVGYLPRAERFAFANAEADAFLVSAAFHPGPRQPASHIAKALCELTTRCRSGFAGAVHLTKQAHTADEALREDHAHTIARLEAARARVDSAGLIHTALGERLGLCSRSAVH